MPILQANVRYLRGWDWAGVARAAIVIGAVLRGLWVLALHPPPDHVYSDMNSYVATAMGLARLDALDRFDAFYPPGTHVLLAIPLWLVGADRDGLFAGAIVWAVLSALTPYFVWRFTRLILPPPAAAIATVLCALWPLHILYAGYFLSETPGLAFLVLSLWLAERAFQRRSIRDGLLAGIAGGIATATRPAFALNMIAVGIPRLRRLRAHVGPGAALALGAALILALVILHNSAAAGRLTGVSENSGLTFYAGHCDVHILNLGRPDGPHYYFGSPVALQLGRGRDVTFPDVEMWDQDFFTEQGIGCIAENGLTHARILLRNVFDMGLSTMPWPLSNEPGVGDVANLTNVAYTAALPFIVFGAVRKIRRSWPMGGGRGELMLLGQLSLVLVTAIFFFGDPRYRTPYDVFGLALAASLLADRIAPAPQRQTAPAVQILRADAARENATG
jgi:4-amino-4-deoxy-L-arabinose transferase-like glycosyltransferase